MKLRNCLSVAFVLFITALGTAPTAAIADSSTISGLICDASDSLAFRVQKLGGSASSHRSFSELGPATYLCPLTRSKVNNTRIKEVVVTVLRRALAPDFFCGVISNTQQGDVVEFRTLTTSVEGLNALRFSDVPAAPLGTVQIFCSMPPDSEIRSIYLEE